LKLDIWNWKLLFQMFKTLFDFQKNIEYYIFNLNLKNLFDLKISISIQFILKCKF
jgi:hypothetical protein